MVAGYKETSATEDYRWFWTNVLAGAAFARHLGFVLVADRAYQKDGRIVRGLQRGAQSFTPERHWADWRITTRIIHLLQITAETAYDMISPGPSIRRGRGNRKGKRKRLHPPQDIREGMSNAIQIVREGITETAHNLVEITALEHDQKGYTGAVGAVMRQIPRSWCSQ
uniref:Autophagy-related protein 2 n=1 Tax=Anopheles funestus TaxID=62324 RepID=A0A4Y0BLL3_ANOFN